jgi:hypothetical protein
MASNEVQSASGRVSRSEEEDLTPRIQIGLEGSAQYTPQLQIVDIDWLANLPGFNNAGSVQQPLQSDCQQQNNHDGFDFPEHHETLQSQRSPGALPHHDDEIQATRVTYELEGDPLVSRGGNEGASSQHLDYVGDLCQGLEGNPLIRLEPSQVSDDRATEEAQDAEYEEASSESETLQETLPSWQPLYLRRVVLLSFAALFALIAVAIEVLHQQSEQHRGLATSRTGLHYLWTYGPTALLTLVASLWSRVEFQSKMICSWDRMLKGSDRASNTLLGDYPACILPTVICRSIIRRDWTVLLTALVSILVKVGIIISTGLITLSLVEMTTDSVQVELKQVIIDPDYVLDVQRGSNPSWEIMRGLTFGVIEAPGGISPEFAYQEIDTTGLDWNDSSRLQVTVDGASNSLQCETASIAPGTAYRVPSGSHINLTSASFEMSGYFSAGIFLRPREETTLSTSTSRVL